MRKQVIENAAYEVATQVRTVEDSIDGVLAEMAELQARIMRVNAVAHTGYGTIHAALEQLSSALSALIESRGAIVACHVALSEAKTKVPGLRTVAFGEPDECPPSEGFATPGLRVVA